MVAFVVNSDPILGFTNAIGRTLMISTTELTSYRMTSQKHTTIPILYNVLVLTCILLTDRMGSFTFP